MRPETTTGLLEANGILAADTFPSVYAGTVAAFTWAVAAHDKGRELRDLAVLMNKIDPTRVRVTLATREHWRRAGHEVAYPELLARLEAKDEALLLLVAHRDRDTDQVFTIDEMKEALSRVIGRIEGRAKSFAGNLTKDFDGIGSRFRKVGGEIADVTKK